MSDGDQRAFVRLNEWVSDCSYATVTIERAAVIEIRDAPHDVVGRDSMYHATVVTKHKSYVVQGSRPGISERIWPKARTCSECKRPL